MATNPEDSLAFAADAFSQLDAPEGETETKKDPIDGDQVEEPLDNEEAQEDEPDQSGDEPEDQKQEDEPAKPAIDPPARWDADQRKVFAALPAEAQQVIAASFKDQERAIGSKAEEAAAARKQAEAVVTQASQLHQTYADQLNQYAAMILPQAPDPRLAQVDPQAYVQQKAMYDAGMAQHQELMQRSAAARQQAEQLEQHQRNEAVRSDYARLVEAIPDYADQAKRQDMLKDWTATAEVLGYPSDRMGLADSTDLLGLKTATEWRTKAEKWDQLQASKMAVVRDAKNKPSRVATPGTAQPRGSAQAQGFKESMTRLRASGDLKDAAAAFSRLG